MYAISRYILNICTRFACNPTIWTHRSKKPLVAHVDENYSGVDQDCGIGCRVEGINSSMSYWFWIKGPKIRLYSMKISHRKKPITILTIKRFRRFMIEFLMQLLRERISGNKLYRNERLKTFHYVWCCGNTLRNLSKTRVVFPHWHCNIWPIISHEKCMPLLHEPWSLQWTNLKVGLIL